MPPDRPLHILHLTTRLTRAAGGAWHYIDGLARSLESIAVRCTVAGVVDRGVTDHETLFASQIITGPPSLLPANYGFSSELKRRLDRELQPVDLIHAHGFRSGTDLLAMRVADRFNAKLLLSPHGLFHPAIVERGGLVKGVVDLLWANRYRRRVDALLAVGPTEEQVIRDAVPHKPVTMLPIGIDAAAYEGPKSRAALEGQAPKAGGKRVVLYLAHMYVNKGVTRLADAWLAMHRERPDWHLILAGVDVTGLGKSTAERMIAAGAGDSFTLLGPVFAEEKRQLFRAADVFTMPSDAESFGIAFAESLVSGVPIIATRGAPWSSVVEQKCGWWIEPTSDALAAALRAATALSDEDRRAMGERGRALVRENFDWRVIAPRVRDLYERLLVPSPGIPGEG